MVKSFVIISEDKVLRQHFWLGISLSWVFWVKFVEPTFWVKFVESNFCGQINSGISFWCCSTCAPCVSFLALGLSGMGEVLNILWRIPDTIDEAHRSISSRDRNVLEGWYIYLENVLNFLGVLLDRFEGSEPEVQLAAQQREASKPVSPWNETQREVSLNIIRPKN